jgi:hypothetical protein
MQISGCPRRLYPTKHTHEARVIFALDDGYWKESDTVIKEKEG